MPAVAHQLWLRLYLQKRKDEDKVVPPDHDQCRICLESDAPPDEELTDPSRVLVASMIDGHLVSIPRATVLFVLLKTREVGDKRLHMRGRARIRDDGPGSSARRALTLSVKGFYIGVGSA